jgi:hypothetical protein
MHLRSAWIALSGALALTGACALVGGYDFDGYVVDGGSDVPTAAGDSGTGSPADAADAGPNSADASGCDANLKLDPRNCGACGHDCLRGVCAGGACQPWTIVSGETAKPCPGGFCGPSSLALMPGAIFWTFFAPSGGIFRGDLTDGGVRKLTAQPWPVLAATDATFVYWTDGASILRCPVQSCGGSPPQPYEPDTYQSPNGFAFTGNSIYWTVGATGDAGPGQVLTSDNGLRPTAKVLVSGQASPLGIAIDGTSIYWVDLGTAPAMTDGAVMRADLDGQNVRPLATGQHAPQSIGVHGGRIYWVNAGTPPSYLDGSVMTCDPLSCVPAPIAEDQPYPFQMAVDATGVYWTTTEASADAGNSAALPIMRCSPPTPGCTPTPIATGSYPWALAMDDKAVYWTDVGIGTVMALAK